MFRSSPANLSHSVERKWKTSMRGGCLGNTYWTYRWVSLTGHIASTGSLSISSDLRQQFPAKPTDWPECLATRRVWRNDYGSRLRGVGPIATPHAPTMFHQDFTIRARPGRLPSAYSVDVRFWPAATYQPANAPRMLTSLRRRTSQAAKRRSKK